MRKKILYISTLYAIVVFVFSACSIAAENNDITEEPIASEVFADNVEKADIELEELEKTDEIISVEELGNDEETSDSEIIETENTFEQGVLYREDFEIPDCRGMGYTNLVDFYNDYPNGKPGGTFENAGLLVHYRDDIDMDMSVEESLSFRTYRGIGLGNTLEEVFDVYGTEEIKPPFEEAMGLSNEEHVLTSFVDYDGRIESGALAGIRFYFDQNNTVMYIDYAATYAQYASAADVKNVITE